MAYIKPDFKDRIFDRVSTDPELLQTVLEDFAGEPRHEGKELSFVCPNCGARALKFTPSAHGKMVYKCFSCNEVAGSHAINFLMGPGVRKSMQDAIEYVCNIYNVAVEYEEYEKPVRKATKKGSSSPASFCKTMLEASGLTKEDVTAHVYAHEGDSGTVAFPTFQKGTMSSSMEIDKDGNDMVIYYFDIEGYPCKYTPKAPNRTAKPVERQYWRVRYEFPEAHKDSSGKPMKYKSPKGAPTFIYYPEAIRRKYRSKEQIETLFIQEGEKKAEKACKHGILSVAISGIQNLGQYGQLPADLVKVIRDCQVKEVVFLMDSDLYDIHKNLSENDNVAKRPQNFFYAVQHYKEYMNSLKNQNLYVEIYYGHVLKNELQDKGIDDLLTNTLKGKEEELLQDILQAKNEKEMLGKYVRLFKITSVNDEKIKMQFSLESPQTFCKLHYDELKHLGAFTYNGRKYRFNEKKELESAQPVEKDEQFWEEKNEDLRFCRTGALTFLERRGFHRYDRPNNDEYEFVQVEHGVAKVIPIHQIVDYIYNFTKDCLPIRVRELLLAGGTQYLGPYQLARLEVFKGQFYVPERGLDYLFFSDQAWEITADRIRKVDYIDVHFNLWADQKHIEQAVTLSGPLIKVSQDEGGEFSFELTSAGQQCDFLRFLVNASNFTWRKSEVSAQEMADNAQHLVSKLCAFGYLANAYKDKSTAKAVVAMDGKQQDFDEANGRTGKSLFGEALRRVVKNKQLNGKELGNSNTNRQFIWDGVNEKTKLVIGDDLLKDFDFDSLFSLITADWTVNPKGHTSYTIPFAQSPKIFLSSNYAIAGDGSSYSARMWLLAFADFYSDTHAPIDDFKVLFFEEWDNTQWNLFWNFVSQCIQLYFRFGYVPAPDDRLEERRLMQQIGEDFIAWADPYYAPDAGHINQKILRDDVYKSFLEYVQGLRGPKFTLSPKSFSQRMQYYVRLRKLYFNPQKYDPKTKTWLEYDKDGRPKKLDKSNGKEWYTIGNSDYYSTFGGEISIPGLSVIDDLPDEDDNEDRY